MQTRGHKADFAHFLIESGEQLLSLLWPAADARRAASLEIIARTAYTAEESACHYLETIGLDQTGAIRKTLELALRQESNEQTHEDIFSCDLGGLYLWTDRFVARHVACSCLCLLDICSYDLVGSRVSLFAWRSC